MLTRLVPAMLGLLAAGSPLAAASTSERDSHFETLRQLVGAEMHLVAKRQLDAYRGAGYSDPGGHYATVAEWLFYDTFALDVPGEAGATYAAEAKRLTAKLKAERDALPPDLKSVFQVSGKIQRIATKLNRDLLKPDSAPPLVGYTDDEIASMQSLVKLLIATADATMAEQMQAVKDYEPTYEKTFAMDENKEFWAITQQATLLRFDHANTFYQAYKPLREIVIRRDELIKAGVPSEFIDEVVDKWLDETSSELAEEYTNWDWSFGDYYIYLRHRLAVLLSEYIRQVKAKGRDKALTSYDDVQTMFYGGIEVDASSFGRDMKDTIIKFKYEIWSDLLYWHLAMGDEASLKQATGLWQTFTELSEDDRKFEGDSSDTYRNVMWGHLHMLRGRIAQRSGDMTTANALMSEVQSSQNFFQGNAKSWIAYWVNQGSAGGGDAWVGQPRVMDPERAVTLAKAMISQANKVLDPADADTFYTQAAVALRDGILGLPSDSMDPVFVAQAPTLYQSLGYALYKRGWYYQAATVVHEGLRRFEPDLWGKEPSTKNPWFSGGTPTPSGAMIRRLANDALAYSQALYARTRSEATNALLETAIEQLRAYDPDSVEENADRMQIVLLIQQGEYQRAHDKSVDYYDANTEAYKTAKGEAKIKALVEALWGLRMATRSMYQLWDEQVTKNAPETEVEKSAKRLEELATILTKMAGVGDKLGDTLPEKYRGEFEKAKQEVVNFQIAKMFKEEQYQQIIALLSPEFWEDAPRDETLIRGFMGYLSGAVYRLNKDAVTAIQAEAKAAGGDPAKIAAVIDSTMGTLLGQWREYGHARMTFARVVNQYPALELQAEGIRKQLAQVFNLTGILGESLVVPNVTKLGDAGNGALRRWIAAAAGDDVEDPAAWLKATSPDAFKAADGDADGALSDAELDSPRSAAAAAQALVRASKGYFADLYEPIVDAGEKDSTVLAVANTLWELDEKARAAKLYEMYKQRLAQRPDLNAFLADTKGAAADVAAVVTGRSELKPFWDPTLKGSIPDLVWDKEGFVEQEYNDANMKRADWSEEKANPFAAQKKIEEFRTAYEKVAGLLANADEGRAALDAFQKQVEDWAYSIVIDTRLIEAYREIGKLNKAVPMAKARYQEDPRDPTFMAVVVDGTLELAKKGQAGAEEIKEAREIAAQLRGDSKRASDLFNYWLAYIQVLELSQYMPGEEDVIKRILKGFSARKTLPSEDLYKPVDKDFELAQTPAGYGVLKKTIKELDADGGVVENERLVGTLDRSALQIIDRLKALYSLENVQLPDPIGVTERRVTGEDGAPKKVYLIEYDFGGEE